MRQQLRIYFSLRLVEYFFLFISATFPQFKSLSRGVSKGRKAFNNLKVLGVSRTTMFGYLQSVYLVVDQICFIQYVSGYTMLPMDKLCKTLWTSVAILKPINQKTRSLIGIVLMGKLFDGLIGFSSSYIVLFEIPVSIAGLLGVVNKSHQSNVFQLAAQSSERIQKYINSNHNSSFLKSIKSGSIPLLNPDLHEFVDRTHERTPVRYKTQRMRAQEAQDEFLRGHLKAGPYTKLPLNMRNEILAKEKMPLRFGKNPRTENQRLQEELDHSNYVDHTSRDLTMAYRPNWKPTQREKWVSDSDFKQAGGKFTEKTAWQQIPFRNPDDNYIYMEQENSLIEFKRMRSEGLEKMGKLPFNPVIKKNPYTQYSTSIRTFKQDQAFGIENKTLFSQNSQLKNYKSALISTKSMDHIMPYNHSNNKQQITNLFPNVDKQYLKSSVQLGGELKEIKLKTPNEDIDEFPKSSKGQPSPIREYPLSDDFNNTNFEKTNTNMRRGFQPFKVYDEEETKQIIQKYFQKGNF
ncbi:unnamed protein product [Paramecium octaurelia]|uniref:Uncharacterized protein n=1 Tax=Paramecium octaurelia TaxID=43137 RepID=A0A8S1U0B0_PAROT|nr:unnamed protein product [Paramecium octaurelia]